MNLTKYGIWITYGGLGREHAAEAARLVEQLGFGTFWLGGSEEPEQLRPLLEASDGVVAATGITNIWASEPGAVAEQAAALEAAFPGRALIGIGAGHREHTAEYVRPLTAMREFLDGLDAAPVPLPRERPRARRARPQDARARRFPRGRRAPLFHAGGAHSLRP